MGAPRTEGDVLYLRVDEVLLCISPRHPEERARVWSNGRWVDVALSGWEAAEIREAEVVRTEAAEGLTKRRPA